MKYLITFFALFAIYIYGCGNDTTTNNGNNGNGETVIYSLDSLSITLNTIFGIIDSNLVINNAPNIKITFSCSTNADSVNSFVQYRISALDSNNFFLDTTNNWISTMNNDHVILIQGSNNFYLNFYLQISGNAPYFIRLRNVKIVRIE